MIRSVFAALAPLFVLGGLGIVAAQAPAPAPPAPPAAVQHVNAQQFIQTLVKQVGNQDPRIRFALREALVAMGVQAVPALQQAKQAEPSPHVKAFVGRTLDRIRKTAKRKKSRFGALLPLFAGQGRDIDRIAMELNLTFEQMARLEPVFKKYDKDVKELYAAMREEGGFTDAEAWKDLRDEMKLLQEETRPKLSEFLDEKQSRRALRYLRRSSLGGVPLMLGAQGGDIQIFEGPGGKTGVMIRRVQKDGGDGK